MHIGIQTHTGSEVFTPYVFAKQGEYRCDPCWMPTVLTEFVNWVRVRVCRGSMGLALFTEAATSIVRGPTHC